MFLVSSGIQQKYIIVTCNYVARERGLTKLMSVTDAREKCPELVLVKGEDLTNYREMSYKVTGGQDYYNESVNKAALASVLTQTGAFSKVVRIVFCINFLKYSE